MHQLGEHLKKLMPNSDLQFILKEYENSMSTRSILLIFLCAYPPQLIVIIVNENKVPDCCHIRDSLCMLLCRWPKSWPFFYYNTKIF